MASDMAHAEPQTSDTIQKERPGTDHGSKSVLSLTGPLTDHLRDTYGNPGIFVEA